MYMYIICIIVCNGIIIFMYTRIIVCTHTRVYCFTKYGKHLYLSWLSFVKTLFNLTIPFQVVYLITTCTRVQY